MAYFSDKGAHCNYTYCKQFDFLPLTCNRCKLQFCSAHFKPEDHDCKEFDNSVKRVIICPFCNTSVLLTPGEDPNYTLEFIHGPYCNKQIKKPKLKSCSIKGCQEILNDINTVKCNQCGILTCLKHRYHDSHSNLKSWAFQEPFKSTTSSSSNRDKKGNIKHIKPKKKSTCKIQ